MVRAEQFLHEFDFPGAHQGLLGGRDEGGAGCSRLGATTICTWKANDGNCSKAATRMRS